MSSNPQSSTTGDSPPIVNLGDLWRFKWRIALTTLIFIGFSEAYLAVTPLTYEVSSRVLVQEDNPSLEAALVGVADKEFLATQAEVIRSPLIIREALQQAPVTLPEGFELGAVAFVMESLTVTPIIQTDVLKIVYRGQDAQEAKAITSALIAKFEEHIQQADQGRNADDLELLTRREAEVRAELEELQDEYAEFRRSSPLIGESRETLIVLSNQLSQWGERLSEASNRRIGLDNKLNAYAVAKAEKQTGDRFAQVIPVALVGDDSTPRLLPAGPVAPSDNDPATNVLRDVSNAGGEDFTEIQIQLWQARVLLQTLEKKYTADHPDMAGAEDQVRYWEDLLEQRIQAAEFGLTQELEVAKTTEANLQKLYDEERVRVKQLDDDLVAQSALVAKIARSEETHATALTRLKQYELTEESLEKGRSSASVCVLDGPQLQEEIVWPQPKILLGLSGVLGLLAGVVLVSLQKH